MENDGFGEVGEAEEGGGGVGSVLRLVGLWGRRGGGVGRCWRLRQNWQRWVPLPSSGGHCHQRGCAEQLVPTNHLSKEHYNWYLLLRYIQYETNRDYPKGFVRLP